MNKKAFDFVSYAMGRQAGGGGGITPADNGKVVVNGALVSQTDETVTVNGVVDTTTIKQVTVNVPVGLDYDLQEVTVANNKGTVDRAFDNFILFAQIVPDDIPAPADRARLYAYSLMSIYIDGHFLTSDTSSADKGMAAATHTAGSADIIAKLSDMKQTVIGPTSITFSAYDSQNMQPGAWKVLQIELPSTMPFYSFLSL